jgi:hypothetical protein
MSDEREEDWVEDWIYARARPLAGAVRVVLQMITGIAIAIYISVSALGVVISANHNYRGEAETLLIAIAYGLVVSAGFDLAFMLFTKGPDEAVNPLVVALSGASIILLSEGAFFGQWQGSLALAVMVLSIGGLFWVQKTFLQKN